MFAAMMFMILIPELIRTKWNQ